MTEADTTANLSSTLEVLGCTIRYQLIFQLEDDLPVDSSVWGTLIAKGPDSGANLALDKDEFSIGRAAGMFCLWTSNLISFKCSLFREQPRDR
jgi:hypothetical protein